MDRYLSAAQIKARRLVEEFYPAVALVAPRVLVGNHAQRERPPVKAVAVPEIKPRQFLHRNRNYADAFFAEGLVVAVESFVVQRMIHSDDVAREVVQCVGAHIFPVAVMGEHVYGVASGRLFEVLPQIFHLQSAHELAAAYGGEIYHVDEILRQLVVESAFDASKLFRALLRK